MDYNPDNNAGENKNNTELQPEQREPEKRRGVNPAENFGQYNNNNAGGFYGAPAGGAANNPQMYPGATPGNQPYSYQPTDPNYTNVPPQYNGAPGNSYPPTNAPGYGTNAYQANQHNKNSQQPQYPTTPGNPGQYMGMPPYGAGQPQPTPPVYPPQPPQAAPWQAPGQNNAPHTPPYTPSGAHDYNKTPADIYNSQNHTQFAGEPQYHYGRPVNMIDNRYYYEQQARNLRRRAQQADLRKAATVTSIAMLSYLVAGTVLSLIIGLGDLRALYSSNLLFSSAFSIFYSVLAVGLPFMLAKGFYTKIDLHPDIPFNKPKGGLKVLLLILIGFGGCLAANYITNIFANICEGFGIYFRSSTADSPTNIWEIILMFVGTAIVPPLIEECAIRGIVMQSLRKYGNAFAIITSSFCFGIFHGSPTQIPFAFMCALFMGYAVIATDSIWTGVAIHCLMNSLSCIYTTLNLYTSEKSADTIITIITLVFLVAGVAALIVYINKYKNEKVLAYKGFGEFTTGEKFRKFLGNPGMIIAVILFVFEALSLITTQSKVY